MDSAYIMKRKRISIMKRAIGTLCLWGAMCIGTNWAYGQTPFRHLQHNNKLRTTETTSTQAPTNLQSRETNSPDLHPVRLNKRQASQRSRRRQRFAPQQARYSSQDLYLEIRSGKGMEDLKAQNRKMRSGK